MEPKYSILLCNQSMEEYREKIDNWLKKGIKVIWLGSADEVENLKRNFAPFAEAFILLAYEISVKDQKIIVDGCDSDGFVKDVLREKCPQFDSAQYLVEHCNDKNHIIVQASAGTGKTTVMIDRVLYLLHTQSDLHLYEIFMITFTNAATDQMNKRLQDVLMRRYKLTRDTRYLRWVEEQSQMNVSTIHSFAYSMLKEYGIGESFTKDLSIRSFQYERRELIKDVIDDKIYSIIKDNQLGIPSYRAYSMANDFWKRFSELGISRREIGDMGWGEPKSPKAKPFHELIKGILERLDEEYFDIKRKNEAVALDDIMRDLQEVLESENLPRPGITMKYLFIDEFQDSDLSQIMVACLMVKLLNPRLFVVGDVKQSIYGFRGATDQAFDALKRFMKKIGKETGSPYGFVEFALINNYRTSENVLYRMHDYFTKWGEMELLQYDKPVIPFNMEEGRIQIIHGEDEQRADDQIAKIASDALEALAKWLERSKKDPNEKTRVVMLTRTNNELNQLDGILRRKHIPHAIRRDGSFYASEAVRDFYIMIASFVFSDEPKYIFNFLLTPYAGEIDPMNINDMEDLHGDHKDLVSYLDRYLEQTNWKKYRKELRLRPVLAVLKDILDKEPVVDNYIRNSKARMKADGWEENRCNAAASNDARQYQANLEKLMEILREEFGGDKVSIYDIYRFLKLNVATNRSETEAEVVTSAEQARSLYQFLLCMTVHKSKGLEFDTIIIPYTNRIFPLGEQTEIIIDPVREKVGWNYEDDREKKNEKEMRNDLYDELKKIDRENVSKEETRILYVAMTRAIRNLICIVPDKKSDDTWAHLFEMVGVDAEFEEADVDE